MYKRMTLSEVTAINSRFFDNLGELMRKQGHHLLTGWVKQVCKECPRTYYFNGPKPAFRVYHQWGQYRFIDEEEAIDLVVEEGDLSQVHNVLKDTWKLKSISKQVSILEGLLDDYRGDMVNTIDGKPFVVYDIETTTASSGKQIFEIAYSIRSDADHSEGLVRDYVDKDNLDEYIDSLLDYDGWVIGYNNFHFDNPVMLANANRSAEQLELLNQKSLDPFIVIQKLLGRRMSLGNLAWALIWVGKTLWSWAEWAEYLKKYNETWQQRYLDKVKDYCKNDVEITLWVILYFLTYNDIRFDGKSHTIDEAVFLKLWWYQKLEEDTGSQQGWAFGK